MVIAVQLIESTLLPVVGNPVLLRLDGQVKAPLFTILSDSWTDAERAEYGIYIAVPFITPVGFHNIGSPSYAFRDGSGDTIVDETYSVEADDTGPVTFGDNRATTGTAVLDYGATPGFSASVFVPAQLNLKSGSKVQIWFQADEMGVGDAFNSVDSHLLAAQAIKLTSGAPISEDGFWIYAESNFSLWTGKFRVRWSWSQ